jgi:DNA-binding response OmpR family regulator
MILSDNQHLKYIKMKIQLNRILLVEDNEDDLELTLDALRANNFANEVDVARDGAEALDFLFCREKWSERDSINPVVILLDLKLPKISGLEVLKKIRETDETKMIPVVILTSSREEQDIIEGYRLGTNAYVVKPVVFNEFIEAVRLLGAFWGIINEPPYQK